MVAINIQASVHGPEYSWFVKDDHDTDDCDGDASREIVVMRGSAPSGGITVGSCKGIGHGHSLWVHDAVHDTAIIRTLLRMAVIWLKSRDVCGVLIRVDSPKNSRRYHHAGFRPVHGIPNMRSAPLDVLVKKLRVEDGRIGR